MKVRDLLCCLNDTESCSTPGEICEAAQRAVCETQEFIAAYDESAASRFNDSRASELADHLWQSHVNSSHCSPTNCPFATDLATWQIRRQQTVLWSKWLERERRHPNKSARWSADKTLSVYLSLSIRGLKPGTRFKLRRLASRRILCDGNSRVRILAALGQLDCELEVAES